MDQGDLLTLDELLTCTEHEVALPELSKAVGVAKRLRFRRIARSDYLSLVPLPPAEAETEGWPVERFAAKELEWLRALPPEGQAQRRQETNDTVYRVIALAAVKPPLTAEEARRLGNDGMAVFDAIMTASGIVSPAPTTAPADGAA